MLREVRGLVIRATDIRESDRLVTIFTEEMGVVTALARGARSFKSRKMSATMLYCYASFVLYGQNDKYWVRDCELIESFFDLRKTIDGLALAGYVVDVLGDVTVAEADTELLRLSLNTLYAIAHRKYPVETIKAAFEIRTASVLGFMPAVLGCARCGEKQGSFFFDIMDGTLECEKCHGEEYRFEPLPEGEEELHRVRIITEGVRSALTYCIYAPVEKIFAFRLSDEDMRLFSKTAEEYLLNHLERSFRTLDFYYQVKK